MISDRTKKQKHVVQRHKVGHNNQRQKLIWWFNRENSVITVSTSIDKFE